MGKSKVERLAEAWAAEKLEEERLRREAEMDMSTPPPNDEKRPPVNGEKPPISEDDFEEIRDSQAPLPKGEQNLNTSQESEGLTSGEIVGLVAVAGVVVAIVAYTKSRLF